MNQFKLVMCREVEEHLTKIHYNLKSDLMAVCIYHQQQRTMMGKDPHSWLQIVGLKVVDVFIS